VKHVCKLPILLLLLALAPAGKAQDLVIETFDSQPETRWRFFSDQVMGGVSSGEARFGKEAGESFARMTGTVSTANNGGFIQNRTELPGGLPETTTGIRLVVRGNDQRYFVHLRTTGTALPWQYYQAGFEAGQDWAEVRLPLSAFEPSGAMLRDTPLAGTLRSVGIVAYGRDHQAQIDVKEIGFY
jgi:hypothetical protein